jgi:transcriptional regulator
VRDTVSVYLPKHNVADAETVNALLRGVVVADLISATTEGPFVTFLPVIYDSTVGPHGVLLGHVARKNEHWRLQTIGESMAILRDADAYISPSWYASKRDGGRVVPTWNYTTAHVYGELRIHDDKVWCEALVRRLTQIHEADRAEPWSVDDAPRPYVDGQLGAIVGVELLISRVEAKAKLGQNRSQADVEGVLNGLRRDGQPDLAEMTEQVARRTRAGGSDI